MVPILGLAIKQLPNLGNIIGLVLAVGGLYLLSVTEEFTMARSDIYILIGAVFWAGHVQIIGWLSSRYNAISIAVGQYFVCTGLSIIAAGFYETIIWADILAAWKPIVFAGILSTGIAFTLQIIAMRNSKPTHAAIVMSLETVFAAVGGWLILNELMSGRHIIGGTLMLVPVLGLRPV